MSAAQVYVVSGAGRGIGLALVQQIAADASNVVYAGVRDVEKASSALKSLASTAKNVKIVELISADAASNKATAALIEKEQGHVDVVFANAGIGYESASVLESTAAAYTEHFQVNTLGPIVLFQAFHSLLSVNPGSKFAVISTLIGSLAATGSLPFSLPAYAVSKAGVNMAVRTIHFETEKEKLVAFPIHPGLVGTDMGNGAVSTAPEAASGALASMLITPEQSAKSVLAFTKAASRADHGGRFWSYDGSEAAW